MKNNLPERPAGTEYRSRHELARLNSRVRTIPKHAHPVVKALFRMMMDEGLTYQEMANEVGGGFSAYTLWRWRKDVNPSLGNLCACLAVFGKRLAVMNEKNEEWQPVAAESEQEWVERTCLRCGVHTRLPRHRRLCHDCKKENDKIVEGMIE